MADWFTEHAPQWLQSGGSPPAQTQTVPLSTVFTPATAGFVRSRLQQALTGKDPVAYTRITRSPVFTYGDESDLASAKQPMDDHSVWINTSRMKEGRESEVLRHESTHAAVQPVLDLLSHDPLISRDLDAVRQGLEKKSPLYKGVSANNLITEALAYSTNEDVPGIEDPGERRAFVDRATATMRAIGRSDIAEQYGRLTRPRPAPALPPGGNE